MPSLKLLQFLQALFPKPLPQVSVPGEADSVKLSDSDLGQLVPLPGRTHVGHPTRQPPVLRPLIRHTAIAISLPVVQQGRVHFLRMLLLGLPLETEPLQSPDILGVEPPLLLALPHILQPAHKVSIHTFLGGAEITMPMPFLESRERGHQLVQVPAVESAAEQRPTETKGIQSADARLAQSALLLPPPNTVDPVCELPVQRVAPRHIAVPVFPLERLQFLETLFPNLAKIDAPTEADLVKLSDLGLRQQVPVPGMTHFTYPRCQPLFLRPLAGHTAVAIPFPVLRQGRKSLVPTVPPRMLGPLTGEPPSCLVLSHSPTFFASTGRNPLMFALGRRWHPLPLISLHNYSFVHRLQHRLQRL